MSQPSGAVRASSSLKYTSASSADAPHISALGRSPTQTAGRSGRPNSLQRLSSVNWTQRTPAGLPWGMPGMGEDMEGAMQHAPQPGRQKKAGEPGGGGAGVRLAGRPCSLSPPLPFLSDFVTRPIIHDLDDAEIAVGEDAFGHYPADLAADGDVQAAALALFAVGRVPGQERIRAVVALIAHRLEGGGAAEFVEEHAAGGGAAVVGQRHVGRVVINGCPGDVVAQIGDGEPDHLAQIAGERAEGELFRAVVEECEQPGGLAEHVALAVAIAVVGAKQRQAKHLEPRSPLHARRVDGEDLFGFHGHPRFVGRHAELALLAHVSGANPRPADDTRPMHVALHRFGESDEPVLGDYCIRIDFHCCHDDI